MFEILDTAIPGLKEMRPVIRGDERGRLVKTVHAEYFATHGMSAAFTEQYYSTSARGVVRGLHFQTPPHDHYKLVTCLDGEVFDVVVDLRRRSPSFGRHVTFRLDGETSSQVYIPSGCAHGFCSLTERATLLYNVSTVYAPTHDSGIRWNSAGIDWPVRNPLISSRDASLPKMQDFNTPF